MDSKETKSVPYYAKKIEELIEATPGVSKTSLAEGIKRDRNTIKNYISGYTSIKLDDLTNIAEFFNQPVTAFIDPSANTSNQISLDNSSTVWKKLCEEKDERIKELKEQLEFLKKFYEQFSKGQ